MIRVPLRKPSANPIEARSAEALAERWRRADVDPPQDRHRIREPKPTGPRQEPLPGNALEPPEEAVKGLAAAVVVHAMKDVYVRDVVRALDALLWLTGPDIAFWLEALEIEAQDLLTLATQRDLRRRICSRLVWPSTRTRRAA